MNAASASTTTAGRACTARSARDEPPSRTRSLGTRGILASAGDGADGPLLSVVVTVTVTGTVTSTVTGRVWVTTFVSVTVFCTVCVCVCVLVCTVVTTSVCVLVFVTVREFVTAFVTVCDRVSTAVVGLYCVTATVCVFPETVTRWVFTTGTRRTTFCRIVRTFPFVVISSVRNDVCVWSTVCGFESTFTLTLRTWTTGTTFRTILPFSRTVTILFTVST